MHKLVKRIDQSRNAYRKEIKEKIQRNVSYSHVTIGKLINLAGIFQDH